MKKSFYALELFVQPGGLRGSLVFVFDNLEDIKRVVPKYCSCYSAFKLITWYGGEVNLLVYQEGKEVQKLNLLPYIRIHIEDYPKARYDSNGQLITVKFNNKSFKKEDDENDKSELNSSRSIKKIKSLDLACVVDWDAISIQSLQGELVKKGDKVTIFSNYIEAKERVGYGVNETEFGLYRETIDWEADELEWREEDEIDWEDEDWEVDEDED